MSNTTNIPTLEAELNITLPPDYKQFLSEQDGAELNGVTFHVADLQQEVTMGILYGVTSKVESADLIYNNEEYGDDLPEHSLLIGSDKGGGWILLVFDGINDGVWYYDHSYFFEQSTDELNTYFIAGSFAAFMDLFGNR